MCIRDSANTDYKHKFKKEDQEFTLSAQFTNNNRDVDYTSQFDPSYIPVSYTHLRAHETVLDLVCRLLLEKKKHKTSKISTHYNY